MKIHQEELSDVTRYIENFGTVNIADYEGQYENYMRILRRFKDITPETRILEIGTGTGWFPIMCKMRGLQCKGLEISPQLIRHAKELGQHYGVDPDIELGNIEESEVGDNDYDIVVAFSVFEHVEHWRRGLERVYKALRPGGMLMFGSTNKFGPSGEFDFPLYGWLPDKWRYKLRIAKQGPDIMKLGIDFNQFRYPVLRKAFREIGFKKVYDRVEFADPQFTSSPGRGRVLSLCKKLPPMKAIVLTFIQDTNFVCIK
jgi:SAM-dependent methyltransferase